MLRKIKVGLVNFLPGGARAVLFRLYGALSRAAYTWSGAQKTFQGAYLRVAHRRVTAHDEVEFAKGRYPDLAKWHSAFKSYESPDGALALPLAWTHKPLGGNYGDWLSPFIVSRASGLAVHHVDLLSRRRRPHIIALGSIASWATGSSTVLGAGVNSYNDVLSRAANYPMVRGMVTLDLLPREARRSDVVCCDPGFFLKKVYTPTVLESPERYKLLIPHINHQELFSTVKDPRFVLKDAYACHPAEITRTIDLIYNAEQVVTSAMHVFVTCLVYGVPCALVKPENSDMIPGDGVKYLDCMSTVLPYDFAPQVINVRKGMALLDEVEIKRHVIDENHVELSYNRFCELLQVGLQ